jgi:hypothetical protein
MFESMVEDFPYNEKEVRGKGPTLFHPLLDLKGLSGLTINTHSCNCSLNE